MYKEKILKNGLKIVTSNMPHMESVSIGIWIGVGSRYETKELSGMSHILEHMLFKGTVTRDANALKESIEGIGGSFNAFTGEEVTCYLVKIPSSRLELGLDILSDMVINPTLDPAELEKEKHVICEEIKMYMDQPSHRVFDILNEIMWPGHALGQPIAGYIDTVKSFKREDLALFKEKYYDPSNISIVACGKVDEEMCVDFARKTFSTPKVGKEVTYKHITDKNKGNAIKLFEKKTEQTHIAFGFHSVDRTHSLRYPMLLLNVILGGNMSSRLFDRLREDKALCYEIASGVKKYNDTGAFVIHAGVDNNKLNEAVVEILHELNEVKKDSIAKDELSRAKEYSRGQLLMALEDTASRMIWLGDRMMLEGKAPPMKEVFERIEKVTPEDIKKAANQVFTKQNLNFALVGPVNESRKKELTKVITL